MLQQGFGDYDSALQQYEKSREICEKIGDISGMAENFNQIASVNFVRNNYPNALRYLVRAFAIFAKIGSPHARTAMNNILIVKAKLPVEEFAKILAEFDFPADVFDRAGNKPAPEGE